MTVPFIIYALPRSRTAWLSRFLTYRQWECYHETSMFFRSPNDVKLFLNSGYVGCAETAAVFGRPLIKHFAPDIKEVVVLRPMEDAIDSVLKINISEVGHYDKLHLRRIMEYGGRLLKEIAQDPSVLTVTFDELHKEEVCTKIFEHCLPYKFDRAWWESLKDTNIQIDTKALLRYRLAHRSEIDEFKRQCKLELLKLCRAGEIPLRKVA